MVALSSGSSRSSREAMIDCTESGRGRSSRSKPDSKPPLLGGEANVFGHIQRVSLRTLHQRQLGGGRHHYPAGEGGDQVGSFVGIQGCEPMVSPSRFPPPQPGRRSNHSGRAVQIRRIGAS